jgi:hypothetical protein
LFADDDLTIGQGTAFAFPTFPNRPVAFKLASRRRSIIATSFTVVRITSIAGLPIVLGSEGSRMKLSRRTWLLGTAAVLAGVSSAHAQVPGAVEQTARNTVGGVGGVEHPLKRAVDLAAASLDVCSRIQDCAYTFVKREEVNGKLGEHEAIFMKVRHAPFSVYCYTLGPKQAKGQEAIYVEGRNNGKVLAHVTGFRHKLVGMVTLDTDSPEIMEDNRYSLISAGPLKMVEKVVGLYKLEMTQGESDVQIFAGAKVDNHTCTCVQVAHAVRQQNFPFQMTRIFYDEQTSLPIRWEAYDWPRNAGERQRLAEEYTYRNLQVNCGLTDADFDPKNPKYGFN